MTARFITIAQVKGGSGKSTLATNLAGALSAKLKVGVIDADQPQATTASWATIRNDEGLSVETPTNARELVAAAQAMDGTCEVVIIDTPPRLHDMSRAALVLSDLALIPISGSAPDVWATQDMISLIAEAKTKTPRLKARLVWNRYRPTKTSEATIAEISSQLGIEAMASKMGNRVAYSEAIGRGLTVLQWPDPKAQAEVMALVREIRRELKL